MLFLSDVEPRVLQIGAEVPIDSEEADEENRSAKGKTLLYVFERGYAGIELPPCRSRLICLAIFPCNDWSNGHCTMLMIRLHLQF